jgi:hypothetical protein
MIDIKSLLPEQIDRQEIKEALTIIDGTIVKVIDTKNNKILYDSP